MKGCVFLSVPVRPVIPSHPQAKTQGCFACARHDMCLDLTADSDACEVLEEIT